MSKLLRQVSREEWHSPMPATIEAISAGSLQRIADAVEVVAKNYNALRDERDRYERWYKEERERTARLHLRIRALRGVITKLKQSARRGRKEGR